MGHRKIEFRINRRQGDRDLNCYKQKGGYGSGTDSEPDKYLIDAYSVFQQQMRENTSLGLDGHTWNTKIPKHGTIVQNRFAMLLNGSSLESLKNSDLETKKLSQRPLKADKFQELPLFRCLMITFTMTAICQNLFC